MNRFKKYWLDLLDTIGSVAFRFVSILLINLPVHVAYGLAEVVGTLIYYCARKRRRQIYANLAKVYPQGLPFDQKKFARKVFINFCYLVMEFFLVKRHLNHRNWREFVTDGDIDWFMQQRSQLDRGAVLITGHIGNFLVLAHIGIFLGYECNTVMRPIGPQRITRAFMDLFEWSGQRMVLKKGAYEVLKEVLAQQKGFPTTVIDQHAGRRALYVDFMGVKAYTFAGPAALARQFNVPIYVAAMIRTGMLRFAFYIERLEPIITDDKQADLENMMTAINQLLAKHIQRAPAQWFWMHRRWRPPKKHS